ncbi:glycine cleavage system aminomethyltransferase GcvT [Effusibacillus lacus]|uniref:Aminomethyltransferase n=1 Tax=Effusibacillus lacus TaxID=1348429 RepID=A0A292YPQ6_9BACL|nr:glycine cleavage system aminomethyltransferase GcvT [Effusibacillus lacus]TCS72549.1 aminomethyltransferase [Effusibacillus lacus]GAX90889.1 glycine cleavage system protein T [Effusibacillus lacus]
MTELKRTPLYPVYSEYGGKTIDFGGWELPVQFTSILEEHEAVRTRAGLFDVSHMGEIEVKGPDALANIQKWITNDASKIEIGQALYSPMCYPDGGCVDDLLVYRLDTDHYLLVVNAANIEKDYEWVKQNSFGNVEIANLSPGIAQLALQGPLAEQILRKLTDYDLSQIKYYWFARDVNVAGFKCLVSRTGYTGEDGFEIYTDAEHAPAVWKAILDAGKEEGVVPAGLGARDTLRFEARLPLYGQEISESISPVEAGLGMFVKLDKGDFIGREALSKQKEEGPKRKLAGFEMIERGIPRSHYEVQVEGRKIGEVTTGTMGPTVKKNIGLALIEADYAKIGQELDVIIRNKPVKGVIIKTPFYKREK